VWDNTRSMSHDDRLRHLSNITVITAKIRYDVILVLLTEETYEACS
jgi:hypothetical protein